MDGLPSGRDVLKGVRVCWQRHDAKTASEHLAPFTMGNQKFSRIRASLKSNGAGRPRHPSPAFSVKPMHYRV